MRIGKGADPEAVWRIQLPFQEVTAHVLYLCIVSLRVCSIIDTCYVVILLWLLNGPAACNSVTNSAGVLKAPVGLSKSKQELLTNTGSNVLAQNRIIVEKKIGTKARHSFWLAIAFVFAIVFAYFCNSPATHMIGHSLEGRFDVVSLRLLFPWLQVLQHMRLPLMTPVTISIVTISMVAGSAARAAAPDEPQVPGGGRWVRTCWWRVTTRVATWWTRPRTTCCCRRSAPWCKARAPGHANPSAAERCCSQVQYHLRFTVRCFKLSVGEVGGWGRYSSTFVCRTVQWNQFYTRVPTFLDWQNSLTFPVFFAIFQYFFNVLFF